MALLSLCACARSATHDMIKTHMTRAHTNTSSTHDIHHTMKFTINHYATELMFLNMCKHNKINPQNLNPLNSFSHARVGNYYSYHQLRPISTN